MRAEMMRSAIAGIGLLAAFLGETSALGANVPMHVVVTNGCHGDTRPLIDNDTDAHRFKNRRVELRRDNCN